MKIKWFNVSSFLIEADNGTRIITDPYAYNYKPQLLPLPPNFETDRPGIEEATDVVTISHGHFDHSYVGAGNIRGVPRLYTGGESRNYKGVRFTGTAAYHDPVDHDHHGIVNLIGIEAGGVRVRHMGDYGQKRLFNEQLEQIGRVDILMTPWGEWVPALLEQLKPKVVLPMHHARIDSYMRSLPGFTDLTRESSELEFTADSLPTEMKVIMLKNSLETHM